MTDQSIRDSSKEMPAERTDWGEIRRRVDQAQWATGHRTEGTPDEIQIILKERARELAKEPVKEDTGEKFIDIIAFRLASETYGIESEFVREVYPLKDFTSLPGVPPFVLGIVNVRGQILSVVDLKKFFNLPEKGLGELNKIIILRNDRMEFGILADVILGVQRTVLDTLQPLSVKVTGIGADYVRGVSREHVIVLDAGTILRDPEIVVNQLVE